MNNLRFFERAVAAVPRAHFGGEAWLGEERVGVARSFADFERLLDFGCGCGRFLRHLGSLADRVEIHGTDIDAEMIDWLRANVRFGRYEVAPQAPPLPYPDDYFDLVISHSVFTHLDERDQDLWLRELQRITRPDALLLLTVQGQSTWNRTRQDLERAGEDVERWQAELDSRGILFIPTDQFLGSTHPESYHSTIHAPWYVFERWPQFFDVEAYLPDGSWSQDLVVLRRRPDTAPAPRPIPRPAPSASPVDAPHASAAQATPVPLRRAIAQRLRRLIRRDLAAAGSTRSADPRALAKPDPNGLDPESTRRELNMLRAGLYEQGRRISVLAAQLRQEIASSRERVDRD